MKISIDVARLIRHRAGQGLCFLVASNNIFCTKENALGFASLNFRKQGEKKKFPIEMFSQVFWLLWLPKMVNTSLC